ncbi:MAG: endonuclease/exonuclease/phosphatase family protein [Gemmatimonadota bacterium]
MIDKRVWNGVVVAAVASAACMYPHAMAEPVAAPSCGPQDGRAEPIRWIHPARDGDVRQLANWCASVGPPEFVLAPQRVSIDSGPDARDVTVVTWNVQGRAGDIPGFLREELAYDCETRRGTEHFVVLVQEGVRRSGRVPEAALEYSPALGSAATSHRPDFIAAARGCGLSFLYVPSMRNGLEGYADGREDRGNALLSSLPLLDPTAIELPFEGQRRVAVMASIEAPASRDTIRFVSLHLDTFAGVARVLLSGASSKERQVLGLVEALGLGANDDGEARRGSAMILVAGDLNTWSERQTAVRRLAEYFPDSPPVDDQATRGEFPTDHMFVLLGRPRTPGSDATASPARRPTVDPGSYELIGNRHLSDHKPRLLRVTGSR